MRTAPATTSLRIHTAVMAAASPQALADLVSDPTPADLADFDERMASLTGLDDGQVCARIGIPAELLPKFRQLIATETVR